MTHNDIAKQYNLETSQAGACGTIHGYEVGIVTEYRGYVRIAVANYFFKAALTPEQAGIVAATLKKHRVRAEWVSDRRIVRIPLFAVVGSQKAFEMIDVTFHAAADAFTAAGLVQFEGCALCEAEGSDHVRLIRGLAMKTHDACYAKLMGEVQEAYRKIDTSTEHLGRGYVFAVIGAVVGAVANLLISNLIDMQWSLLYALIPLGAMLMYKAAKAPLRKEVPYVLAALSIVVSVGSIVLVYYLAALGWEMTLSAFLTEGIPEDPNIMSYFLEDLGIAALFSFLGVTIIWRYMFQPRK